MPNGVKTKQKIRNKITVEVIWPIISPIFSHILKGKKRIFGMKTEVKINDKDNNTIHHIIKPL
jgi:hypothetical protein